jgi:hypothetical protein
VPLPQETKTREEGKEMTELTPEQEDLVIALFPEGTILPSTSRSDYNSDEEYKAALRKLYELAKISNMLHEEEK